jgi:arginyl-tRNA synthetase
MKQIIAGLLAGEAGIPKEELLDLIEIPPQPELGDFAFPCFGLAKTRKQSPLKIAEEIAEKLRKKLPKEISGADFKGGYVNFFTNKALFAETVLSQVGKAGFGENESGKGKRVVIDMSSPNIAKPFGIGHLRSTIIGNSIGEIAKANGYKVTKINYLGDWGTQFGKIILAYKKWGDEKKLKKDAIGHLQELYVRVNADESLEEEARVEFKKLEDGDKENLKLWKEFRELSLKKFEDIYKLLGVEFDVVSGESEYNDKMEAIIGELQKKKLMKKDEGAMIVDLKDEGLGAVLIQKSDGASLYATRDLAAAKDRYEKYKFDKLIYEVGQEQTLHFKQVFRVLELLGYKWASNCVHVSHGLYLDSDGKKFSTRKGKTVYMADVLEEVVEKAKKNLSEREKLGKAELEKRALKIAIAAIFYGDLKNSRENNMIFDVDNFLSFEGDTGPYLLYSYARASSIVRKAKSKKKLKILDLKDAEVKLLKKIDSLGEVVEKAYLQLAPNVVATYSFELAQVFNEFYHSCPVMGSEEEGFRLKLVDAFRATLKKALGLLGIEVLEEM